MTDGEDDRGFVARWSRRKAAARAAEPEPPADDASPPAVDPASEEAERQSNRAAAEAIDLESLADNPDVTPFLKAGVPDALRRAALRKLFRSNPVLANVDGLVDYGEDFRNPSMILTTFRSAWQAGRGYLDAGANRRNRTETARVDDGLPTQETLVEPAEDPPPSDTEPSVDPAAMDEPAPEPGSITKAPSLRSRLGLDLPDPDPEPVPPRSPAGGLRDAE